jgi:outer membrane protein insertion porin family
MEDDVLEGKSVTSSRLFRLLFSFLMMLSALSNLRAQEFKIKEISFANAYAFDRKVLLDLIHSRSKDEFDARLVKLDKILLTNYYRKQGFLTVDVFDSLVVNKSERKIDIYYLFREGRRYYLGQIQFTGNAEITTDQLKQQIKDIELYSPFDESRLVEAKQKIENLYYDNGKPFIEINMDYEFAQDSLVITKFQISENQTVYIRDIQYQGLHDSRKFLIKRELEIKKGEKYNRENITFSQENIYGTGLFDYVRFDLEPLARDTNGVNVKIMVQEKKSRWIGARVGYAYEQEEVYGNKIEFALEGGHRNLFGTGHSLSLHLVPSLQYDFNSHKIHNPENQVSMIFVEPWLGIAKTPLTFHTSYHQYRPLNSADFNVLLFGLNVSHKSATSKAWRHEKDLTLSAATQVKLVDVLSEGTLDTTLETDLGKDQIYTATLYARQDTKNNYFNPTYGAVTDLSIGFSHSIGKDEFGDKQSNRYFTVISSWQRYQPMGTKEFRKKKKVTLASRIKAGSIFELGGTKNIPVSELFFAGGASSVRGYPEQLLGPCVLDEKGFKTSALGGKMLLLMNAELRIPIYWLFLTEIFIDGGNVWQEVKYFNPTQIKFSTGIGLVLITPIGPVRFDYGIKLMKEPSDRTADNFHLGFYFAF